MLNDELMEFTAFLMTQGKMPEMTFGEVIDTIQAFRREHGYCVNTTDDTQPKRDTQKKLNQTSTINRISAKDFNQIDNAASKFADAITSTQDLAQEIVSVCISRLDYVYSDLVLAIADLKERSGVKD